MAAVATVVQSSLPRKFQQVPRTGVVTLCGYGIKANVDRGHLVLEDGIGPERHHWRLPRVGHNLERLVVIGADGCVSLAAIRWLADQGAAFVMLDRDGSVLATTGPVRPSDARLRRAQARAENPGVALEIARELIDKKLAGQERVAREKLLDETAAHAIAECRAQVGTATAISQIRQLEARGAAAYWNTWRDLPIMFPKQQLPRVPDRWLRFGTRQSPLTGSQRLAANPPNAMLNYLYAVLESESRLAAAALGLDPGLGFIHLDTPARDSLACDLMEPVRPQVDAFLLDWVTRQPLNRSWFFEQRDGSCRLMSDFAVRLAQTAPIWARAVAPFAERIARQLWSRKRAEDCPPTRLTQDRKRTARGVAPMAVVVARPVVDTICPGCGGKLGRGSSKCTKCAGPSLTARLTEAAKRGRIAARSPEAGAKRARKQREHARARAEWDRSDTIQMSEAEFSERIQPQLAGVSTSAIARALGVSRWYAGRIRKGHKPHPRHWERLARLPLP